MTTENEELKALKCLDCGGDLVKSYRTEYDDEEEENVSIPVAKCISCSREYDQHTQEYYEVFADDLTFDKDNTVFKLGAKGVLGGVEYEVIGRIRYQEEDEYEKATWDEWFAVSGDGVYHYFVEEEGEVHSYEEYIPQSIDIESDPASIDFEGKKISKNDGFVGRIVYAEGELPWKPEIGEPVTMYDFKKEGVKYSIEQSEGEVSITRGERISYDDIIAAFGGEKDRVLYDETKKKRRQYRLKAAVYLLAMIASLCLSAFSCLSTVPVKGVMDRKTVMGANDARIEEGGRVFISQVLYGPFIMDKGDSLYTIDVSVDEKVQNLNLEWQSFRLMLIGEDRLKNAVGSQFAPAVMKGVFDDIDAMKEPVECYSLSGDFWDEEGYDSDGYWHEDSLSIDDSFVLDEAGSYRILLELYSNKPRNISSVILKLNRTRSYRYYVILTVIFLILTGFNRSRSRSYNAMPFEMASE